jgi:hypothetical protein
MINSFGNIGGFVAPNIKVTAETHFRSSLAGPVSLASITFLGALLVAFMRNRGTDSVRPGVAS